MMKHDYRKWDTAEILLLKEKFQCALFNAPRRKAAHTVRMIGTATVQQKVDKLRQAWGV